MELIWKTVRIAGRMDIDILVRGNTVHRYEETTMAQTHNSNPATFIPLKPSVFSILMVLSESDSHGYGIKKEVESRSNNQVRLEPGTLYRVIGKLLDDGLIGEAGGDPVENDDERRKYYTLLPLGRRVLVAETERLALLIDSARSRNLIDPRQAP